MTAVHSIKRLRRSVPRRRTTNSTSIVAASVATGVLAAIALLNQHLARKAERENPPSGRFLEVTGVRLHYVERGTGDPVVLLTATEA